LTRSKKKSGRWFKWLEIIRWSARHVAGAITRQHEK